MKITGAKIFTPGGFCESELNTEAGFIAGKSGDGTVYDAGGCYIIPGLTDLHFHGCRGADLSDGDPAGLETMAEYELSRGVTQICPAGMTLLEPDLELVCRAAAAHKKAGKPGAELVGVNLEGPFLSRAKKGAQNGDWLHEPDAEMLERLIEASEGLVKLVSVAPELPGAMEFIEKASKQVTVAIAHTTADYDTAREALRRGARQITHLFNAMPPFGHREPGVVGAAFDNGETMVELICDGVHIHPAVVRATFQLFGADRVILISDSLRATGMPDGKYPFGGQEIVIKGNRAVLAHEPDTLAGSVTDLMGCVKTAVSFGITLCDAVRAAALNPARALGIDGDFGTLEPGKRANFVVLDGQLNIKNVVFNGEIVSPSK